jgi:small basic protein (TIGR04137 family)
MSIDRSLKVKGALSRHRNVLSRGERIETLKLEERFTDGDTVMGLPKVAHRKAATGKKEAKVKVAATPEAAAAAAAGTPAAPAAAAAQQPQQKKAAAKK